MKMKSILEKLKKGLPLTAEEITKYIMFGPKEISLGALKASQKTYKNTTGLGL